MTKHLRYFLIAVEAYLLFLIRGLHNNHFLDWSLDGDCIEIPLIGWYMQINTFIKEKE